MSPEEFDSHRISMSNALNVAGIGKETTDKLHPRNTIVVEEDKHFTCGRVTAFAVHIGTARGKVWACVENGDLIDEDGHGLGQAKRIFNSTETPIRFLPSNRWPTSIVTDVEGLLRPELLALVRLDVFRWAGLREARNTSSAIMPAFEPLVNAMELYRIHVGLEGDDAEGPDIQEELRPASTQPQGASNGLKEDTLDLEDMDDRSESSPEHSDCEENVTYFADYERAEGVEYASKFAMLDAIGGKLMSELPTSRAFIFSERKTEDYLPVRLRIGDCYETKTGVLCMLWVYLKPTQQRKHAPHIDYIVGRPIVAKDIQLLANTKKEEIKGMNYRALCTELANGTARLLPLYHLFGDHTSEAELQALIKYAFLLAVEHPELDLPDHLIPLNNTFITNLRKVCQRLRYYTVNLEVRRTGLPLRRVDHDPSRSTEISCQSAQDIKVTGLIDLDKVPDDVLKGLQESSPVRSIREERRGGHRYLARNEAYIADQDSPGRDIETVHRGVLRSVSPSASSDMMMHTNDLIDSDASDGSSSSRDSSKDGGDDHAEMRVRRSLSAASQSRSSPRSAASATPELSVSRSILLSLARGPKVLPIYHMKPVLNNLNILAKNRKVLKGRIFKSRSAYDRKRALKKQQKPQSRSSRRINELNRQIDELVGVADTQDAHIKMLCDLTSED